MSSETNAGIILVVDDDRAVRTLVRHSLERSGYRTLEAASGEEALRLFQEHQAGIELILTDVVMPGMGGLELARHIREAAPELPVLIMSALSGRPGETSEFPFLLKPFVASELLCRVREVLALKKAIGKEDHGDERRLKSA